MELALDGNMEGMSRKRARGKRSGPVPNAGTIVRAMLGAALLYNKLLRASGAAGPKAALAARRYGGKGCACKGRCPCHRGKLAAPIRATGAMSVGATGLGALAVGALAVGALAIRRLAIKRGEVERLDIRELKVGRLEVDELLVREETRSQPPTPPGGSSGGGPGAPSGPMPA